MRPLPPFKLKPVRFQSVRRQVTADTIRDLAGQEPEGIRPARAAMRLASPLRRSTLKVLGRPANDHD